MSNEANMMEKECSICQEKYRKDQYNFKIKGERQDFIGESKWQEVIEAPLENVCSKCYNHLIRHYKNYIQKMKENKGDVAIQYIEI